MIIKPEYFVLKFTEELYFIHPLLLVVSTRDRGTYGFIKILRRIRKRPGYNFLRHIQPDRNYENNEFALSKYLFSYLNSRYTRPSSHVLDIYEY